MGEGLIKEDTNLKMTLNIYQHGSRQKISLAKSSIFFFNTPEHKKFKIASIIGCKIGTFPDSYLGLPLCQGLAPNSFWVNLVEKFHNKLARWKGAFLSQAGKLQLLKASLQSLPIYAMSLFKIPIKIVEKLERI